MLIRHQRSRTHEQANKGHHHRARALGLWALLLLLLLSYSLLPGPLLAVWLAHRQAEAVLPQTELSKEWGLSTKSGMVCRGRRGGRQKQDRGPGYGLGTRVLVQGTLSSRRMWDVEVVLVHATYTAGGYVPACETWRRAGRFPTWLLL